MSISIRRTKHLDEYDIDRIDPRNEAVMTLLHNKLIMRADDNHEGERQIEDAFMWCKDNCTDFYSIRGPESDKNTLKYYLYFMNEDEMTLFATTFPRESDEE